MLQISLRVGRRELKRGQGGGGEGGNILQVQLLYICSLMCADVLVYNRGKKERKEGKVRQRNVKRNLEGQ